MASLADAAYGPDDKKDGAPVAVSISASPVSVDDGAKRLFAALKGHDVDAVADAYRLMWHACCEEYKAAKDGGSAPELDDEG